MGKRKVVNKIEAYSGMYINHNRNTYQLVQKILLRSIVKVVLYIIIAVQIELYNCVDRVIYLERQSYNERRILDRLDNWWWYSTCNISGYTKL